MSDLQENLNKIINDLDKNIENKKDLEYIKTQICNISMLFMDELDKMAELNMNRVDKLIEKHRVLTSRMQELEAKMQLIEDELYIDEENEEDLGFEIVCPYCNTEFEIDITEINSDIKCPECNNIIELDWNQEEDECDGHCGHCHHCDDEECDCEDEDM